MATKKKKPYVRPRWDDVPVFTKDLKQEHAAALTELEKLRVKLAEVRLENELLRAALRCSLLEAEQLRTKRRQTP